MALLTVEEGRRLRSALDKNAFEDVGMVMSRDTSFLGTEQEVTVEDYVISCVKSVPTHY